jgi:LysM repeat protein
VLCGGWRWIAGGALIGLLGAFLALQMIPAKWQSSAMIQIGQVGQVGQVASIPVETAAQAVERINTGSFQLEVARELKHEAWLEAISTNEKGGKKYFRAAVPKNSTRIALTTFGTSTESALQIAEGIVAALAKRHKEMAGATLARMQNELSVTEEKLKALTEDSKALDRAISSGHVTDPRFFSQFALLSSVRIRKEDEVYALRQHKVAIELALTPPATQPTKVIEEIYVARDPVSPRPALVLFVGIVGGLMLGAAALFVRSRRTNGAARQA